MNNHRISRFTSSIVAGCLIATALVSLASPAGAATTWSVPGDFATIQEAIDAAAPGDLIAVGPGTYVGTVDFTGKDVTLTATAGPESTILNAAGASGVLIGPGGTLDGFTVQQASGSSGAGIKTTGSGSVIQGNIIRDNAQSAGGFGAGVGGNSSSPVIVGNIFRNNTCDSQFVSGVVSFVNGTSPFIANNIFEDNGCRAINLTLPTGNSPRVMNNTFVDNTVAIRVDRRVDSSTYIFRNNILVGNLIGLEVDFGTEAKNPTWEHNLVYGNGIDYEIITDQTGINGNISEPPSFVGVDDFHLDVSSPAIDAGTAANAPLVDFDGESRPIDGNGDGAAEFDIGAYEANVGDPTAPTVTALLIPLQIGGKHGRFEVDFNCVDNIDPAPIVSAAINGIEVADGDEVTLRKAADFRVTTKNGLRIWAPDFELVVTCTDDAGNAATATATALVDPPVVVPGIAAIIEGTGSNRVVDVPVTLSSPSSEIVAVEWQTIDIPAHPNVAHPVSDFIADSGTLIFPPGTTAAFVSIEIVGDDLPEPPLLFGEWGLIQFSEATNAEVGGWFGGLGVFAIVDDD